jgi:hypothetical protein
VDTRGEIRDFLTSRRARVTPEQAGLPVYGGSRRLAGLRREEVALLAGSASTTTPVSNAGTPAGYPTACSKRSPARAARRDQRGSSVAPRRKKARPGERNC